MFQFINIPIPEEIAYAIIFFFFAGVVSITLFLHATKRKRVFESEVLHALINAGMSNVRIVKKCTYNLIFKYNNENYYMKFMLGGPKKGIVMTNSHTIYLQEFRNESSAALINEVMTSITSFLLEKLDGHKVILIYNNLMRASRYINENELEAITYQKDAFKIRFVCERDLPNYLLLIKNNESEEKKK